MFRLVLACACMPLLTHCVTVMAPPTVIAAPQTVEAPSSHTPTPKTAQVAAPQGNVRFAYLIGKAPTGGALKDTTPGGLQAEMSKRAPKRASAADKRVFSQYGGGGSKRAANWMRALDFSGVSWDQTRTATLISDRHVVMSAHYDRPRGASITFHGRDGRPVTRRLAAVKRAPSNGRVSIPDITVGVLDRPVPNTVTYYPLPAPGKYQALLKGAPVLVTDGKRRVHRFEITGVIHSSTIDFMRTGSLFKSTLDPSWKEMMVAGDSGNPAFLLSGGKLILVSTHTLGGMGTTGPFYGGEKIQQFVRNAIADLDRSLR